MIEMVVLALFLLLSLLGNVVLGHLYLKNRAKIIVVDGRTGKKRTIDLLKKCCPHEDCPHYKQKRKGNLIYRRMYSKHNDRVLLRCTTCNRTFSETRDTAYFNVKKCLQIFFSVLTHLSYNDGIRDTARKVSIHRDTVMAYVKRAGNQSKKLEILLRNLRCVEIQLDELWGFIKKKKKNIKDLQEYCAGFGDRWTWLAFDPVSKFVLAHVNGKRVEENCKQLLELVKERTRSGKKLFTSDELRTYATWISKVFDVKEVLYAIVHKTREKGRVVAVEERIIYGAYEEIEKIIEQSPVSKHINTSFVERKNLDIRQKNRRMTRKTQSFSKDPGMHDYQMEFTVAFGNFCHRHSSIKKSPAMALGITDHVWSLEELMSFST